MNNKQKEQPPKTFRRGKSYLMHLVSRSAKTSYEIRQKLRRSDYAENIIDQVIEFGKTYEFIDDQSYTIRWLESCAARKLFGKNKCIQELKKKGIDTEIINEQIELFFNDEAISEYQIALDYLSKKRHLIKGKDLYQQKQKASQKLFQRGFSMDVIKPVISDFFDSDFNSDNNNNYQKRIF